MQMIKNVGLIVLGVLIGIVGGMASQRAEAQALTKIEPGQVIQPGQPVGTIITGEDIGFQLIAPQKEGEVATGKLMIRVNGRWLPAAAPRGVFPAR
jgi:hypothetical protein